MAQLYKKTGTCSRPSGAQTDYPMYLWVGESAGSVIGSELVTNGGFDSNTTGWAAYLGTISSVPGGYSGRCCRLTQSTGEYSKFDEEITGKLILGRRYRLSGYVKSGTSGNETYYIKVHDSTYTDDAAIEGTTSGDWVYVSADFTHTNADTWVKVRCEKHSGTAGTMLFDSISIVEIPQVHCSAHCQTDFGDIRFHDAADAELKYMIDWGSLTGTTPNQTVGVWVAPSPGTSDTNVVIKYGDSALDDASDGTAVFSKYKGFESGSDGDSIATADEDFTVISGTCEIDTAQKYAGTRSLKLVGGAKPDANIALTAGSGYAIRCWARKTNKADYFYPFMHGNGTKRIQFLCSATEDIRYYNSGGVNTDTGYNCAYDAWMLFEVLNIDWTAGTYDLYHNGVCILSAGQMNTTAADANIIRAYNGGSAGNDAWIDDLIVRKYANPEPTWGTWGAEKEIDDSTELVVADPSHAIGSDSVNLIPDSGLAVADSFHAISSDSVNLIPDSGLIVTDSFHAISSDSVNLIPDSELTVTDASSTMSAENLILCLAGQLVVTDSSSASTSDNTDLTQAHVLAVGDSLSASTSDNIDLTQAHVLAVGDSLSALSSEEPVASFDFDLALIVEDSLHSDESDNVVFFQAHTLELSDSILLFEVDGELILAEPWTVPDGFHARLFGDLELLSFGGDLELLSFGGSLELLSFSGSLE